MRRSHLLGEPLCRECLKKERIVKASVVDHIVSRRAGGADFDPDNLQSLCNLCHQKKRNEERNMGPGAEMAAALGQAAGLQDLSNENKIAGENQQVGQKTRK